MSIAMACRALRHIILGRAKIKLHTKEGDTSHVSVGGSSHWRGFRNPPARRDPKPSLVNVRFAVYTLKVQLIQRPIPRIDKIAHAQYQGVGLPAAAIT
jgi:hypothetical protein